MIPFKGNRLGFVGLALIVSAFIYFLLAPKEEWAAVGALWLTSILVMAGLAVIVVGWSKESSRVDQVNSKGKSFGIVIIEVILILIMLWFFLPFFL